jgi:hypothetical protein
MDDDLDQLSQFMHGCLRYRLVLDEQAPDAPRTEEPFGG